MLFYLYSDRGLENQWEYQCIFSNFHISCQSCDTACHDRVPTLIIELLELRGFEIHVVSHLKIY